MVHRADVSVLRRHLRVHVRLSDGQAVVRLVRWRSSLISNEARVATINLAADDADERLAEARMKARDMARDLNGLESSRP